MMMGIIIIMMDDGPHSGPTVVPTRSGATPHSSSSSSWFGFGLVVGSGEMETVMEVLRWTTVSHHVLIWTATCTVAVGAIGAARLDAQARKMPQVEAALAEATLTRETAYLLPLLLSGMLLLLFFAFDYIGLIVSLAGLGYALGGLAMTCHAVVCSVWGQSRSQSRSPGLYGRLFSLQAPLPLLAFPPPPRYVVCCAGIGVAWLFVGGWVLNNVLAVCLSLVVIAAVRLPSLRLAFLILAGLVVFDVLWVFFSESLFGANVMVHVATSEASNPSHAIAQSLNTPQSVFDRIPKTLPMINKLIVPAWDATRPGSYAMLGLGDIALPGVLVAFALRADVSRGAAFPSFNPLSGSLFPAALLGYVAGAFLAVIAVRLSSHPQPALLYLVPSTLAAISLRAFSLGIFSPLLRSHRTPQQVNPV